MKRSPVYSRWSPAALLILTVVAPQAMLRAQQPSTVEQNRLVPPKDAIHGADWLTAQGVQQGLDQLDLGTDSKGHSIRFSISNDGEGVQIKLSGSGLDNALAGDKAGRSIMGKFKKKSGEAKGSSGLTVTDLFRPLKIALDSGDAKKVQAYQKYKGLNDLNLPKRSSAGGHSPLIS